MFAFETYRSMPSDDTHAPVCATATLQGAVIPTTSGAEVPQVCPSAMLQTSVSMTTSAAMMDAPFKARPQVAQAAIHNEMTKTNTNTYPNTQSTAAAIKCGITTTTIETDTGLVAVTKKSPTMPRKRSSDSVEEWECQEPITVDPVKPCAPLKRRFDAITGGRDEWTTAMAAVAPMTNSVSAPVTSTAMIPAAFRLDSREFDAPPALGDLPNDLDILPVENQIDLSEDVPTSMAASENLMTWSATQLFDGMNMMMVPTHMPAMGSDGGPLKRARRGSKSHNQWPVPNEQTSNTVMMPSGNQQWGWETPVTSTFTAVAVAPTPTNFDSEKTHVVTTKSPEMMQCMSLGGSPISHTNSPAPSPGNASPELQSLFSRSSSSNDGGNLSDDGVEPSSASRPGQVDEEAVMVESGETPEDALLRANRVIRGLRAALAMNQQRCAELEAQLTASESGSPQHSPPPRQPSPPQLQLRVSSKVEDVWYADRPFPAFNVELVDMAADAQPVQTRVHGWQLRVTLSDGYGHNALDTLSGQAASHGFTYTLTGGRATITGLRFTAVSSKRGGHFQLGLEVISPSDAASAVDVCYPAKVQVLSYRLYHSPKVALDRLSPSDSLSKVRGIGSLYAKRFANMGVHTVGQLAELNVSSMDEATRKAMLEALRRDRGAMTMAKLENYVNQARSILGRYYADHDE